MQGKPAASPIPQPAQPPPFAIQQLISREHLHLLRERASQSRVRQLELDLRNAQELEVEARLQAMAKDMMMYQASGFNMFM